jgi:hypothetical protein
MISETALTQGITLLSAHYERKLLDDVVKIWKEYLSEHLDETEFKEAVRYSILHERFMPTAGDLVNYVHGNKEAKAIQEWRLVLEAAKNCNDLSQLAYLDVRAQVALQAVGGLQAVGLADSYERQRLEKSFITVYCQSGTKDSKSLPQSSPVSTQEADKAPPEPSPMPEHIKQKIEALKSNFGGIKKKTDEPSHQEEVASSRELPESLRKEVEETMARAQNRHAVQEVLTQDLEF